MTKAKRFGGALVGAVMAVGCAGAGTSVDTAQLDQTTVSSAIDGRTDLFMDLAQSRHLLTADEVNGSPTAVSVEVQVRESELIAWRAQPSIPAAERSRTQADVVGRFNIVGTTDLSTAVAIDNETHPGEPGQVVIPGSAIGGFTGSHGTPSGNQPPRLDRDDAPPAIGLTIDWTTVNGIPNAVTIPPGASRAHPGCA